MGGCHHFQGAWGIVQLATRRVSLLLYMVGQLHLSAVDGVRRRRLHKLNLTTDAHTQKLFPVSKYNIDIQNAYKHQIIITAYRRLPESFYKLSMLATYNT